MSIGRYGIPHGETHEIFVRGRRYVTYDSRGLGTSGPATGALTVDEQVADLEAVVDRLGLPTFDMFGQVDGAAIAAVYAARHPDRVRRMALNASFAAGRDIGEADAQLAFAELCKTNWKMARRLLSGLIEPSGPGGQELPKQAISVADGSTAAKYLEFIAKLDITDELRRVKAPTIVFHDRGNNSVPYAAGQSVAGLIPDARFVTNSGYSFLARELIVNVRAFLDEGLELNAPAASVQVAGSTKPSEFRAVLFTDVVDHTAMMSRLGDERGREVLREHERITRDVLAAHGGTEVKADGDGFMMSFTSVARAVECAVALQRAFAAREGEPLAIRVGLNAGEPIAEEDDLFGATVILAARIKAEAGANEILVPDTVRGLLVGKGFRFADRGEFVPKGFDHPVRLFEVQWRGD